MEAEESRAKVASDQKREYIVSGVFICGETSPVQREVVDVQITNVSMCWEKGEGHCSFDFAQCAHWNWGLAVQCLAFCGYIMGIWSPGYRLQFDTAGVFLLNLLRCHTQTYKAIKSLPGGEQAKVGLVHQFMLFEPKNTGFAATYIRWADFQFCMVLLTMLLLSLWHQLQIAVHAGMAPACLLMATREFGVASLAFSSCLPHNQHHFALMHVSLMCFCWLDKALYVVYKQISWHSDCSGVWNGIRYDKGSCAEFRFWKMPLHSQVHPSLQHCFECLNFKGRI